MGTTAPVRLYAKGVILGPKRSKSNVYHTCTLIKIDGVRTKADTTYYHGKKVAYIFKAKSEKKGSKFRVMGQGQAGSWQFRRRARQVPEEHSAARVRRPGPHHDVPQQRLRGV